MVKRCKNWWNGSVARQPSPKLQSIIFHHLLKQKQSLNKNDSCYEIVALQEIQQVTKECCLWRFTSPKNTPLWPLKFSSLLLSDRSWLSLLFIYIDKQWYDCLIVLHGCKYICHVIFAVILIDLRWSIQLKISWSSANIFYIFTDLASWWICSFWYILRSYDLFGRGSKSQYPSTPWTPQKPLKSSTIGWLAQAQKGSWSWSRFGPTAI